MNKVNLTIYFYNSSDTIVRMKEVRFDTNFTLKANEVGFRIKEAEYPCEYSVRYGKRFCDASLKEKGKYCEMHKIIGRKIDDMFKTRHKDSKLDKIRLQLLEEEVKKYKKFKKLIKKEILELDKQLEHDQELYDVRCDACGNDIKVADGSNYHCSRCPHYCGPAQCTNECCFSFEDDFSKLKL